MEKNIVSFTYPSAVWNPCMGKLYWRVGTSFTPQKYTSTIYSYMCKLRRRVSSVVEHSSANPKVPGSIPGPVSYRGHYDEACFMHLTPGVVHNFPKAVGV